MVSTFVSGDRGAPERIRTSDPRLRRPLLCPPELLARSRKPGSYHGRRGLATSNLCPTCARMVRGPVPAQCQEQRPFLDAERRPTPDSALAVEISATRTDTGRTMAPIVRTPIGRRRLRCFRFRRPPYTCPRPR